MFRPRNAGSTPAYDVVGRVSSGAQVLVEDIFKDAMTHEPAVPCRGAPGDDTGARV